MLINIYQSRVDEYSFLPACVCPMCVYLITNTMYVCVNVNFRPN